MQGSQIDPPGETTLKKPNLIRVKYVPGTLFAPGNELIKLHSSAFLKEQCTLLKILENRNIKILHKKWLLFYEKNSFPMVINNLVMASAVLANLRLT